MPAGWSLLLGVGVFLGSQAVLGFSSHADVLNGQLWDSDAYMRLVRLERLIASADWWQHAVPRGNAPFGETLHWTRPLDLLLLLGAWPALLVTSAKDALFIWGAALSPLLGLACLLLTAWHARRWLPVAAQAPLALLFGLQPAVVAAFSVGRPDHHGLLLLAFATTLALLQSLCLKPDRRLAAALAQPGRILACGNHGPEILYRSQHEVIASPYHRNAAGLKDVHAFFTAADEATAREIAKRRGATLALICPASAEAMACYGDANAPFHRRLAASDLPAWVKPLPVPDALQGSLLLFALQP